MTKIEIDMKKGILHAKGHAGFARYGQDVVCAAVSALTQTAAAAAEKRDGLVGRADGEISIHCEDVGYRVVLEAITEGLRMIARQYPLHVRVKVR